MKAKQIKIAVIVAGVLLIFLCIFLKVRLQRETHYEKIAEKIIQVSVEMDVSKMGSLEEIVETEPPITESPTTEPETVEPEAAATEQATANESEEIMAEQNAEISGQIAVTEGMAEPASEVTLSREELVEKWVDIAVTYTARKKPEIQVPIGAMWNDINENTISVQIYESMETHVSTIYWLKIDIYTGHCEDEIFGEVIDLMEP